jgi:hypothetical protein
MVESADACSVHDRCRVGIELNDLDAMKRLLPFIRRALADCGSLSCAAQRGNVFGIIGCVSKALKRAGQSDRAKEFASRARQCENYDAVLQLCFEFVEVE